MATLDECRTALEQLSAKFAASGNKVDLDRSLGCTLTDLGTGFHGRLKDSRIQDLADGDDPNAKIRLIIGSDDLVGLANGTLDGGKAFRDGRLKVKAGVFDLLKLQKLL
ncbi:hypothetical protein Val02_88540 [Virgisporangium aliadipatigenens]|uniref:SCP2 domain-containing protein n=1 Tax=Virgisporangium aliadipatigenens TaxID=741659 RepID=A0A8J3YYL3_9ACTN|nr:SCP2 sterol-binding domain-containing protein [Virgisporangium aliadipatigenens]GIJ51968.1 hypothetical protein Val02_88540 [Virgisporangium aliadipatigenens]